MRLYAQRMSNVIAFPINPTAAGSVAEEVRAVMGRRRISGTELGRLTGKSQAYWWRRLSGETPFDVNDLLTVATILNVKVKSLVAPLDGESPSPDGGGASTSLSQRARPEGLEPPTFCSGASEGHTCDDTCRKVIVLPVPDPRDLDDVDDVEGWLAPVTALPTAVAR